MTFKYAWRLYTREKYALRMERVIECDIDHERVVRRAWHVSSRPANDGHCHIDCQFLSPGNYSIFNRRIKSVVKLIPSLVDQWNHIFTV